LQESCISHGPFDLDEEDHTPFVLESLDLGDLEPEGIGQAEAQPEYQQEQEGDRSRQEAASSA
jgi:hypothetical protein